MQRPTTLVLLAVGLAAWSGCSLSSAIPAGGDAGPRTDAELADARLAAAPTIDPERRPDAAIDLDDASYSDAAARADAWAPPPVEEPPPDPPEPAPLRYVRFRVGTVNAPESLRAGLLSPPLARAQRLIDWFVTHDVIASATQESGTYLRRAAAERPAWSSTWAPPNNIIRDREIGNGIVYRGGPLEILDQDSLRIPMAGHPRGLNIAIRLFEHRADTDRRARFVMISFHAPTRRDDPSDTVRAEMRRELRAYVRRCHRVGLPVIVAGDSNDGAYGSHFTEDLNVAYHHSVDWILVSPAIRVHGGLSDSIPLLSDHDALVATISVPAASDAPRRLPD